MYPPKANGQTEHFNRTILSSLKRFNADHPKNRDLYTDALTYSYNTQTHSSTGYAPMEFTISRLPPHMAMENYSQLTKNVRLARDSKISKLGKHFGEFRKELIKAQQRYKKNYDKRLRIRRKHFEVGGYTFLRV
eukprot:IDg1758t1